MTDFFFKRESYIFFHPTTFKMELEASLVLAEHESAHYGLGRAESSDTQRSPSPSPTQTLPSQSLTPAGTGAVILPIHRDQIADPAPPYRGRLPCKYQPSFIKFGVGYYLGDDGLNYPYCLVCKGGGVRGNKLLTTTHLRAHHLSAHKDYDGWSESEMLAKFMHLRMDLRSDRTEAITARESELRQRGLQQLVADPQSTHQMTLRDSNRPITIDPSPTPRPLAREVSRARVPPRQAVVARQAQRAVDTAATQHSLELDILGILTNFEEALKQQQGALMHQTEVVTSLKAALLSYFRHR